ncbi:MULTISPECIES: chemotaxis protein CheB [unclassified Yoonia]|uniref:chemotaxis protein CheB n=1 Tax=unclassified Yoonia TaxID=2629118 RepID=UPI002B00313F|nr:MULTISPECIES: chemotaxis protein CheB [unclassified Yoonia]
MNHPDLPRLIVVGASAGGMDALKTLVAQFTADFPAPVLIVNHMSPETTGDMLVQILDRAGPLHCQHADDGLRFVAGHIYVARSDQHMMIEGDSIVLSKGARENRSRPAIDPLFRSAAVAHGNRVIGVILTGYLDDGTSGMMAIKRCGGICIAQDPADATHPDMPQSVIANVGVDYCLPVARMGSLLTKLVREPPPPQIAPPEDIVIESRIARRVLSDLPSVERLGDQVPFNCPDCGGVLWQIKDGAFLRYRCHTGHAFSSAVLLAVQSAKIEETLWSALRMFEERQNLLATMNTRLEGKSSAALVERGKDAQVHIERIRAMLKAIDTPVDVMKAAQPHD